MTIPYLKGWGDTLAENGSQIGQNIAHIINPNIDYQNLLKAAVAKDPTLLQQIANNPGLANSIQQMGLSKNITQQTSGLTPDAATQTANSRARVAQAIEQPTINTAIAGAQSAGAQAQYDTSTVNDKIKDTKNRAALSDVELQGAKQKLQDAQSIISKIPDLGSINIGDLAHKIASGNMTPDDTAAELRIRQDKGGSDALDGAVESINKAKDRVERMNERQLIHNTNNQQERQFNISLLKGLSDSLNKQIVESNAYLKANSNRAFLLTGPEPTKPTSKDPGSPEWQSYNQTMADRTAYKQAQEVAGPNSPYYKKLQSVNNKMALLANLPATMFQDAEAAPAPDAGGKKVATILTSDQISSLAQNADVTDEVLNKNIADGTISPADAQKIQTARKKKSTPATNPMKTGFKYRGLND